MKTENELKIFGYIDLEPPIPGSWKDEVTKLVNEAEGKPAEYYLVSQFQYAVERMRTVQIGIFKTLRDAQNRNRRP